MFRSKNHNEFASQKQQDELEEMDEKPDVVQDEIYTNSINNPERKCAAAQPDYSDQPKPRNLSLPSDRYRTIFNKSSKVAAEDARTDSKSNPQKSNSTFKSDLSPCKKEPDASIVASSDATHGRDSLEDSSPVRIRKRKRPVGVKKCSDTLKDARHNTSEDVVAGPSEIRPRSLKQDGVKAYVCPRCPEEFPNTQDFEVHFEAQHKGEQRLSLEDVSRISSRSLERSANVEESLDTSKDINVSGIRPRSLNQGGKGLICPNCGEVFPNSHDFNVHFDIKHSGEFFQRNIHTKVLAVKKSLQSGHKPHKGKNLVVRDVGKKKFAKDEALDLSHSGKMPFVCTKRFAEKSTLMSHCKTHTGKKSFVCEVCAKEFTQKENLQRHNRTHTGEKPFVCKVCSEEFTQKENLQRHNRTHTGEKPFVCKVCAEKFTQKEHLKRHTRAHTGEKPFVCEVCAKEFSRKDNLQRHNRTHTGDKSK